MSKWLINNPFAVLLVPLVAFILLCTYTHWPKQIDRVEPLPNDTAFYSVVIQTLAQPREKTYRYEAKVLSIDKHPHALLYIRYDSTMQMPSMGDTLLVCTCWQQPQPFNGFDYPTYLRRQGISATGFVNQWGWQVIGANRTPWWRTAQGWQQRLKERYQLLGIQDRELATITALTLGYREDLEPSLRRQFSAAGAMHVLAVSGLHTGILMHVLMLLITAFGLCKPLYEQHTKRWIMGTIVIVALVAYAWLTGATPSVVRSVIMSSMVVLAGMCYRQNQMLNAIFASAFFILVFRPMDLFSVSFQLSYAAVVSIALFAPGWKRIMPHNYFLNLIGMSVAAMIGTLPITLYYYGQLSNFFLLTNLIVIPLAWFMMVGGLFTLTLGWITPVGKLLAWLVNGFTWLMNEGVGWIEHLPCSTTMVQLPLWGLWTLVAVNLVIVLLWDKITTIERSWKFWFILPQRPRRVYIRRQSPPLPEVTKEQKEELITYLTTEVERWRLLMNEEPVTWTIRNMHSQWGNCRPQRRKLTFNLQLALVPNALRDYIIVHELSHLQVQNHGPLFKAREAEFMPDYKARQQALKDYIKQLYETKKQ